MTRSGVEKCSIPLVSSRFWFRYLSCVYVCVSSEILILYQDFFYFHYSFLTFHMVSTPQEERFQCEHSKSCCHWLHSANLLYLLLQQWRRTYFLPCVTSSRASGASWEVAKFECCRVRTKQVPIPAFLTLVLQNWNNNQGPDQPQSLILDPCVHRKTDSEPCVELIIR